MNSNYNNPTADGGVAKMRHLTVTAPVMITLGTTTKGGVEISGNISANGNLNIVALNVKLINSSNAPAEATINMGTTNARQLGINSCVFDRSGKSVKLLNHLNIFNSIQIQNTSLLSNGFNITAIAFNIYPSQVATPAIIDLTGCTLTLTGTWMNKFDLSNNKIITNTCDVISNCKTWILKGYSTEAPPNDLNTIFF